MIVRCGVFSELGGRASINTGLQGVVPPQSLQPRRHEPHETDRGLGKK